MSMNNACSAREEPWTVISAYAPQTRCTEKRLSSTKIGNGITVMANIVGKFVLTGDFNGQAITVAEILGCHRGKGSGQDSEEGRRKLDMADAANKIILNISFCKKRNTNTHTQAKDRKP